MAAAGRAEAQQSATAAGTSAVATPETIGVATQDADGTLVLQLRAERPDGVLGDALLRYAPDHRHDAEVAGHVGSIPKGGSVFVKPWPDR